MTRTDATPAADGPLGLRVAPSATGRIEARVTALRAEGRPLYRLGLGEPDFPVMDHVIDAAIRAARDGAGYTAAAGILSLREAIADHVERRLGIGTDPGSIIVTAGAKQAIAHALAVLCSPGDEVLVPTPYWVSFPEQARLVGAIPRHVAGARTKITAADLDAAASERSRVLILNSPNNPSGAVYTHAELEAIAAVCERRDLWVLSDEVYSAFVFAVDGHASIATVPGMAARTVVVDSASKTYGMPGWRIGYAVGPPHVIAAMTAVASHTTTNASSVAQAAAEAALRGPQDAVEAHRADYAARAERLTERLRRFRHLRQEGPIEGGFFAWVDVSPMVGRSVTGRVIRDADELADAVLESSGVVLQPGTAFGSPRHLRMSVAAPPEEVTQGLDLLERVLDGGGSDGATLLLA